MEFECSLACLLNALVGSYEGIGFIESYCAFCYICHNRAVKSTLALLFLLNNNPFITS